MSRQNNGKAALHASKQHSWEEGPHAAAISWPDRRAPAAVMEEPPASDRHTWPHEQVEIQKAHRKRAVLDVLASARESLC